MDGSSGVSIRPGSLTSFHVRAKVYVIDAVVTRTGRAREFVDRYLAEYAPGATKRGMTLDRILVSPPIWFADESNTVTVCWELAGATGLVGDDVARPARQGPRAMVGRPRGIDRIPAPDHGIGRRRRRRTLRCSSHPADPPRIGAGGIPDRRLIDRMRDVRVRRAPPRRAYVGRLPQRRRHSGTCGVPDQESCADSEPLLDRLLNQYWSPMSTASTTRPNRLPRGRRRDRCIERCWWPSPPRLPQRPWRRSSPTCCACRGMCTPSRRVSSAAPPARWAHHAGLTSSSRSSPMEPD